MTGGASLCSASPFLSDANKATAARPPPRTERKLSRLPVPGPSGALAGVRRVLPSQAKIRSTIQVKPVAPNKGYYYREIRVILYAKADSFCATALADELSVEDILAIEHDVSPLDGADVF